MLYLEVHSSQADREKLKTTSLGRECIFSLSLSTNYKYKYWARNTDSSMMDNSIALDSEIVSSDDTSASRL